MAKTYLKPLNIPDGISVSFNSDILNVKGKLGDMSLRIPKSVKVSQEDQSITFRPEGELEENSALTGTMRALVNNLLQGVEIGF